MTPAQIRAFRQSLGLSAGAFARALDVSSDRLIRSWESGAVKPHAVVVTAILMATELPGGREWLIARSRRKAPIVGD